MTTSTVVFTVLPNPTPTSEGIQVTVLVSPRLLDNGRKLTEFAFGEKPWPQRLSSMGMTVKFDNGLQVQGKLAPPRRPVEALDSDLWSSLFPDSLPIYGWGAVDHRGRTMRSYPVTTVTNAVLDVYNQVAASSPTDFPKLYPATQAPGALDGLVESMSRIPDYVSRWGFDPNEPSMVLELGNAANIKDYYQAVRFYTRRPVQADGSGGPVEEIKNDPYDFHQKLTLLSDHPTLQRKLGLVFDVILPGLTLDPTRLPTQGKMQFLPNWRGAQHPDDKTPSTKYHYLYGQFAAAPNNWGNLDGAYMRLDQTDRFSVHQVDVDSVALKTADFSVATKGRLLDRQQEPIQQTSLPALRSGGFTITQTVRGLQMQAQIATDATNQTLNASDVVLGAEDLLRGYRIDVQKDGKDWHSLCRRFGKLVIDDGKRVIDIPKDQEEEGYVKAMSASSNDVKEPNGRPALYVHEAIAGWSGFSLCARRPGQWIVQTGDSHNPELPQPLENKAATDQNLNVQAEYQPVPRSLPSLRFGHSYRFRARYVDVAGNGTPLSDTLDWHATPAQVYTRYEPLASPTLALRTPITEAESVEHMVIRSDVGVTPAQYANTPLGRSHGYAAWNERHVLPPKTSQAMAETHGMFEGAFKSREDAAAYYRLGTREATTLLDWEMYDLGDGSFIDLSERNQMMLNNPPGMHADQPTVWPGRRGDPLLPGQYVTYDVPNMRVPYLPDPLAIGVALFDNTPNGDEIGPQLTMLNYGTQAGKGRSEFNWAEKGGVRVLLQGKMTDQIERGVGVGDAWSVGFTLPQGRKLTLRYSSLIDPDHLEEMAFWYALDAKTQKQLRTLVLQGRHWMITPYRELVLVHAVQRPVTPPKWVSPPNPSRELGATCVRFNSAISCHGFSTGHIDVRARWVEWLDVVTDTAPTRRDTEADAFRLQVGYNDSGVNTNVTSVTKERAPKTLVNTNIRYLETTATSDLRMSLHEFGDTKHRVVSYRPVGTTRYAEYFPAEITANRANLESDGPESVFVVKSSARPAAPVPLYIVPTFKWETAADGTRTRRGGGVRIYLDRPWFSSGASERLGILLSPTPKEWPAWMSPFISRWGRDPVWSSDMTQLLTPSAFRGLDEQASWAPELAPEPRILAGTAKLAEFPANNPLLVMGVMPVYSPERQLWYADVEFDIGSGYFPMLSLALTRYQPNSLAGVELSSVVRAEFVQIAPDRSATVTVSGNTASVKVWGMTGGNALEWLGDRKQGTSSRPPGSINVTLDPSHAGTPSAGHRVRARLERRAGGAAAGDLAWSTVGATDLMGEWKTQGTEALWTGSLTLPAADGAEYRVVISEAEMYESDNPGTPVNLGGTIFRRNIKQGGERITYLDIVQVR